MSKSEENKRSLLEEALELVDLTVRYVRQQIYTTVDKSVARPIASAGRKAAFYILAFALFSMAAAFIAVAIFLLIALLLGSYTAASFLIGFILLIVGIVVLKRSARS